MFKRTGKGGDGLDVCCLKHFLEAGIEETGIEFVSLSVAFDKVLIRLCDSDELDILARGGAGNEAMRMIVREADNSEAEWSWLGPGAVGPEAKQESKSKEETGESRVHARERLRHDGMEASRLAVEGVRAFRKNGRQEGQKTAQKATT